RHGEKPGEGDAHLAPKGYQRAGALAALFDAKRNGGAYPAIDALFAAASTRESHRPVTTLKPLAGELGVAVDDSYTEKDHARLAAALLGRSYDGKVALICWHHGQIPALASALKATDAPSKWPDERFDLIWRLDYGGAAGRTEIPHPAPAPALRRQGGRLSGLPRTRAPPSLPCMGERPDPRLHAPAVARNREPILAVLRRVLPSTGLVLEVASGSGEHAAFFAAALPQLTWQPSDPDPRARASIAAFRGAGAAPNLLPPLDLDVIAAAWPVTGAAAVVCINMIHIAPWSACEGLVAGAAHALLPGGVLYLYGPYKEEGRHTAPSNAAFDADLRARDPRWGVRDLGAVAALARRGGFAHEETVTMPANNRSLVFRRGD
ncbi:MAG TPA: DUF938 domain-containing protein, partial [Stellaceae bacterium]